MTSHIWRLNGFTMEYLTNDIANLPPDEICNPKWSVNLIDAFLYPHQDARKVADILRSKYGITRPHVETLLDPPERPVEPAIPSHPRHHKPKPSTPKHIPDRIGRLFGYDPFD